MIPLQFLPEVLVAVLPDCLRLRTRLRSFRMKVSQICKLALLASLALGALPAWSFDPGLAGDDSTTSAALEQNYVNETGQYQGGGHENRQLDPDYGGMAKGANAGSGSGGSGTGGGGSSRGPAASQSPSSELKQVSIKDGVSQARPNRKLNDSWGIFGGLEKALGAFAGSSGSRDMKVSSEESTEASMGAAVKPETAKVSAKKLASAPSSAASSNGTADLQSFDTGMNLFDNGNANGGGGSASSEGGSITCAQSEPHPYAPSQCKDSAIDSAIEKDCSKNWGTDGEGGTKELGGAEAGVQAGGSAVLKNKLNNAPGANCGQAKANQNAQKEQGADNLAAMERYHAAAAIDWVRSFLVNFTVDGGNKWNQVRDKLFVPLAILLLLPGAMICQVKSIASQGFAVLGEVSPFEGLFRSIIGIFLIPATYLIVNYGIDVANSITFTISNQYRQQFGSDMYRDAFCGHIRAFPVRSPEENPGMIMDKKTVMFNYFGNTPLARLEGKTLAIKYADPCVGLYIVPPDRDNDNVPYMVNEQRMAYNQANAAFTMAWVILCAVQQAYLYYLYFVGPVAAALWVFPSKQLRDAFPSWIEGVVTICFWSLFWNVTILLMACFRGVDDTGTIMFTALNFLAIGSAKFAFDFTGLVRDAGRESMSMGQKAAQAAAAASKKGEGGGGGGGGDKGGKGCSSGDNASGGAPTGGNSSGGENPSAPDLGVNGAKTSFDANPGMTPGTGTGGGHLVTANHSSVNGTHSPLHNPPPQASAAKDAHAQWAALMSASMGIPANQLGKLNEDIGKSSSSASTDYSQSVQLPDEVSEGDSLVCGKDLNMDLGKLDAAVGGAGSLNPKNASCPPMMGVVADNAGAGASLAQKNAAATLSQDLQQDKAAQSAAQIQAQAAQENQLVSSTRAHMEQEREKQNHAKEESKPEFMARASADFSTANAPQSLDQKGDFVAGFAQHARASVDPAAASAINGSFAVNSGAISAASSAASADAASAAAIAAANNNSFASSSDSVVMIDASQGAANAPAGFDFSSNGPIAGSSNMTDSYTANSNNYEYGRSSVESSPSSFANADYEYPSLTIDGAKNSTSYEQNYSAAYEQTYAASYARSYDAASSQIQNRAQEVQQARQAQNADVTAKAVRMSSQGASVDKRTTNFLTGLVGSATNARSVAQGGAPVPGVNKPQSANGNANAPANAPANANMAKDNNTHTDADSDWSNRLANEIIKRRSRAVQKQSSEDKANDLKALRAMSSRNDK